MYVHGLNLMQKINSKNKYRDEESVKYLQEILPVYNEWKKKNEELRGPYSEVTEEDIRIIEERVSLFNNYKDFIDQQMYAEKFDSRSNLHSSVLEEFIYYLFRDIAKEYNEEALVGKSHAFKDIFFNAESYRDMLDEPNLKIETKDHDFVIGSNIIANFSVQGSEKIEHKELHIPAVAIECKTYIDKTMLEASSTAAEQLKMKNPNAVYIIVAERVKLSEAVNFQKYKVDQIYIFRKQKNTDREYTFVESYIKNPIYTDVVAHLFQYVREHLTVNWEGNLTDGIERGFLINR